MQRATDIAQNALEGSKMRLPGIMHKETDLLDGICKIRTSEGQPLKSSCKATIILRVLDGRPICWQLRINVDRGGARLALSHACALQKVHHVLALREEQASATALHMHPQEVMELTEVLHSELRLQRSDGALKESDRRGREHNVIDVEQQVDHIIAATEDEQGCVRLGLRESQGWCAEGVRQKRPYAANRLYQARGAC